MVVEKNTTPNTGGNMNTTVEGKNVQITPGQILQLDCGVYKTLKPAMWDEAQFCYENPVFGMESPIHINLAITGRTFQYKGGAYWVRVRITWVNDGEPNTYGSGWVKVNPWECY